MIAHSGDQSEDSELGLTQDGSVLQPCREHSSCFSSLWRPADPFWQHLETLEQRWTSPCSCRPPLWYGQVKMLELGRSVSGLHAEDRSGVEPWRGAGKSVRAIHNVISRIGLIS